MKDPIEDHLDRLLAPVAIDPHCVARTVHPYWPEHTLRELETLVAEQAVRDGYQCVEQSPYEWEREAVHCFGDKPDPSRPIQTGVPDSHDLSNAQPVLPRPH
jgi:hypothetical protein